MTMAQDLEETESIKKLRSLSGVDDKKVGSERKMGLHFTHTNKKSKSISHPIKPSNEKL